MRKSRSDLPASSMIATRGLFAPGGLCTPNRVFQKTVGMFCDCRLMSKEDGKIRLGCFSDDNEEES